MCLIRRSLSDTFIIVSWINYITVRVFLINLAKTPLCTNKFFTCHSGRITVKFTYKANFKSEVSYLVGEILYDIRLDIRSLIYLFYWLLIWIKQEQVYYTFGTQSKNTYHVRFFSFAEKCIWGKCPSIPISILLSCTSSQQLIDRLEVERFFPHNTSKNGLLLPLVIAGLCNNFGVLILLFSFIKFLL